MPQASTSLAQRMSGKLRLALAASFIYPALVAALVKPWKGDTIHFVYIGLGPVVVAWLLYWVIIGFRKKKL